MAKYKIEVDRQACIGCGACSVMCPEYFEPDEKDEKQKANVKKAQTDDITCSKEAATICPTNAIHITDLDEDKKLI